MTQYKKLVEGWAWVLGPRKIHFFGKDGRALCGRWLYLGSDYHPEEPENACPVCLKKLQKRREKGG